jgi:hypothetical protein
VSRNLINGVTVFLQWQFNVSSESRTAIVVLRLRIEHTEQRVRGQRRAYKSIERYVLSQYGATRLPSGEHQLKLMYRTDQDLDELMDDLLFEIAGEAQMRDCFSETEARLEGTDRRW